MAIYKKPDPAFLNPYQAYYINLTEGDNLLEFLEKSMEETLQLMKGVSAEKLSYRYAEGKWNILEILVHLIDTERIFVYRMLSISRGETLELPGFDENLYAQESEASERTIEDILEEYISVRKSSLSLLRSFSEKQFLRKGIANKKETSVQIIAFMLAGHEVHHRNVIKTHY
jgi:uncharacterized damage-inducible protein DinB